MIIKIKNQEIDLSGTSIPEAKKIIEQIKQYIETVQVNKIFDGKSLVNSLRYGLEKEVDKVYVYWNIDDEGNKKLYFEPFNPEFEDSPTEGHIDYFRVSYGSFDFTCPNEKFKKLFDVDFRDITDEELDDYAELMEQWAMEEYGN